TKDNSPVKCQRTKEILQDNSLANAKGPEEIPQDDLPVKCQRTKEIPQDKSPEMPKDQKKYQRQFTRNAKGPEVPKTIY
ncbi:21148_t:CDS:1, partial [Gigaspora rosea]